MSTDEKLRASLMEAIRRGADATKTVLKEKCSLRQVSANADKVSDDKIVSASVRELLFIRTALRHRLEAVRRELADIENQLGRHQTEWLGHGVHGQEWECVNCGARWTSPHCRPCIHCFPMNTESKSAAQDALDQLKTGAMP